MALIQCKECKAQISTRAKACPNCGAALKGSNLIIWVIFFVVVYAIFGRPSDTSSFVPKPDIAYDCTERGRPWAIPPEDERCIKLVQAIATVNNCMKIVLDRFIADNKSSRDKVDFNELQSYLELACGSALRNAVIELGQPSKVADKLVASTAEVNLIGYRVGAYP